MGLCSLAGTASALDANDAGTFIAVGDDGEYLEKVLRVTRTAKDWKFEDRQPDGSWVDVSCHGGCEHKPSKAADIERFFGSQPPGGMSIDCVHNAEYAFCHGIKKEDGVPRDLFALVVRGPQGWVPVALFRVPEQAPSTGPNPDNVM
jgi:hypothetical protein